MLLVALAAAGPLPASAQEAVRRDPKLSGPTAAELAAREHHAGGLELMRAERFPEAIVVLRQAVSLDPELIMAHYDLGRASMAARRFPEAVQAYTGCRDAWLRFTDALQKGSFEAGAQRDDRIRDLRDRLRAVQATPAAPGSAEAARKQMETVRLENLILALDPSASRGHARLDVPADLSLALGSALFRNGQLADAEREYLAALAVRPRLGEAHNNLAVVYLMQARPGDAREAIRRAEKAGFRVSAGLKQDVEAALKAQPAP